MKRNWSFDFQTERKCRSKDFTLLQVDLHRVLSGWKSSVLHDSNFPSPRGVRLTPHQEAQTSSHLQKMKQITQLESTQASHEETRGVTSHPHLTHIQSICRICTSSTSPWVSKSRHCVSHLTTPFPGLSNFRPGYFRITPLKQHLSKHPAHILPSSSLEIFYLILPLVSNHTRQQWQLRADLTWEKWFVLKIEWEY